MKPLFAIPVFAILFVAAALFSVSEAYSQETIEYYSNSFSTSSGSKFKAEIDLGNINVTGSSSDNVSIRINGNPDYKNDFIISANQVSDGVELTINYKDKKDRSYKNLSLKVDVTVPSSYSIDLKTKGGNVTANGISGVVEAVSYGGNIKMNSIIGKTDLSTKGGNIVVNSIRGNLNVMTQGGNVLVDAFTGDIKTQTKGGNITLSGGDGSVSAMTNGGNISLEYSGSNLGIDLKTMAGNITAKVPEIISGDAEITATTGKIVSDFITPKKGDEFSVSSRALGKINGGGSPILISTNSGNIKFVKK
ncbi:hypothetical protein BH10BAC5_BH10BAC5_08490 [soil metagenome]